MFIRLYDKYFEIVMLSLFVTHCNKCFSEILKERMLSLLLTLCNNNWNCKELRYHPDFSGLIFPKFSREEENTANWYVIVTWLLWKFPIFNTIPFFFLSQKILIMHGVWNTNNISWTNQYRFSNSSIFLPFLSKFGPKNQNCLVQMKFGNID